jgi:K+-transporting ATPase A subunit
MAFSAALKTLGSGGGGMHAANARQTIEIKMGFIKQLPGK